jgi:hypothetical protein
MTTEPSTNKTVVKKCSCCGKTFTQAEWLALPSVGLQKYPWGEVQEMRNCPCASTLAIVLEIGDPND